MTPQSHILVTGGAGFIGSHVTRKLLEQGYSVTLLDNLDPFYDPAIKQKNIADFKDHPHFHFIKGDIRENDWVALLKTIPAAIIHLAAKAGVRPSISNPAEYIDVNIRGTLNMLEYARTIGVRRFIFGSSSSVYGLNPNVPWKESDTDLQPISPYAQTKIAGEQLCRVYAHLYGMSITVLRFFTVYGPGQRPDLAIHGFVHKILNGEPIPLYGDGSTARDYTYIGDIVQGVVAALERKAPLAFEIFNLGNSQTITLKGLIDAIQEVLNQKAMLKTMPEQPGDVPLTCSDVNAARNALAYAPVTHLREGLMHFFEWYKTTYTTDLITQNT